MSVVVTKWLRKWPQNSGTNTQRQLEGCLWCVLYRCYGVPFVHYNRKYLSSPIYCISSVPHHRITQAHPKDYPRIKTLFCTKLRKIALILYNTIVLYTFCSLSPKNTSTTVSWPSPISQTQSVYSVQMTKNQAKIQKNDSKWRHLKKIIIFFAKIFGL